MDPLMTTRTFRKQMTFTRPFHLRVLNGVFPAGTYAVDTEEESIDGLSFIAYRRTATWIHLPAIGTKALSREMIMVHPSELDAGTEALKPADQAGAASIGL
jgi:hypothetical protein